MFLLEGGVIYSLIESKENNQIKYVVKLATDSKFRKASQQSVIYGYHLIEEAAKHQLLAKLYINESNLTDYEKLIAKYDLSDKVILVLDKIIDKMNLLDSATDCVGLINISQKELLVSHDESYILLENIQDPGNLGTIFRVARAGGINNVVLSPKSVDPYNPKVLRASQGIQFGLNIFTEIDLEQFISSYHGQALAMIPDAAGSIYEVNLNIPTAIVLGNEGNGLTEKLKSKLTNHVSIPMCGDAESLNLAMAATVAVFEMSRQRIIK